MGHTNARINCLWRRRPAHHALPERERVLVHGHHAPRECDDRIVCGVDPGRGLRAWQRACIRACISLADGSHPGVVHLISFSEFHTSIPWESCISDLLAERCRQARSSARSGSASTPPGQVTTAAIKRDGRRLTKALAVGRAFAPVLAAVADTRRARTEDRHKRLRRKVSAVMLCGRGGEPGPILFASSAALGHDREASASRLPLQRAHLRPGGATP